MVTWHVNIPHELALVALVVQLLLTMGLFVLGRAPGWQEIRSFGWVTLTGTVYTGVYTWASGREAPTAVGASFVALNLFVSAWHTAAWLRFSWFGATPWRALPAWFTRVSLMSILTTGVLGLNGVLVRDDVTSLILVPELGVDYVQPRLSTIGLLVVLWFFALLVATGIGLVRRSVHSCRTASLAGYLVFLICVVAEAAIPAFGVNAMYPAPLAFLAAALPLTCELVRRFVGDAERLAWMSATLRTSLADDQRVAVEQLGHLLGTPLQEAFEASSRLGSLLPASDTVSRGYWAQLQGGLARATRTLADLRGAAPLDSATAETDEVVESEGTLGAPRPVPLRSLTVLLVDDEQSVRHALARGLQRGGFSVIEASSGVEALAVLREQSVDLIVSDLMMPGMTGAEFLRSAVALWPGLATRTLIVTGGAITQDAIALLEGESFPVLYKPVTPTALVLALEQALQRKPGTAPISPASEASPPRER